MLDIQRAFEVLADELTKNNHAINFGKSEMITLNEQDILTFKIFW